MHFLLYSKQWLSAEFQYVLIKEEEAVKIYSYAKVLIHMAMLGFIEKHGLTSAQTACKVLHVEENMVRFAIHQKIKVILEKTLADLAAETELGGDIRFSTLTQDVWQAEVRANGAESYFFARMLYATLRRMHDKKVSIERINCNLLGICLNLATVKCLRGYEHRFSIKFDRAKQTYHLLLKIGGMKVTTSNHNCDYLCRWVGSQIRGNFGIR